MLIYLLLLWTNNKYRGGAMMKKTAIIALMITLVALFALSASAITVSDAKIGSDKQDRIKDVTGTLTIQNNQTSTLTITSISTNADIKFNVRFTSLASVAASSSGSVTITADIPLDFDAVEESPSASDYLKEKSFDIGTITVVTSAGTVTGKLFMQAKTSLKSMTADLSAATQQAIQKQTSWMTVTMLKTSSQEWTVHWKSRQKTTLMITIKKM